MSGSPNCKGVSMKLVFSWTRDQIVLCLGTFLLTVLSSLQFHIAPSQAKSQVTTNLPPIEITQGWQYRWGDSPVDETGVPIWTEEEISSPGWQPFQFPKKLKKPSGEKIVWLRVPLPEGQWKSPALYLGAVPYILEAYLENKFIYRQLSSTSAGKINFEDYQWPIVPLERGFQGKTLLFRVYAGKNSSIYVGLFDRVTVGSQSTLIKRLFRQESDALLGIGFTFLGLTAILVAFKRQEAKAYPYFGLFSIFTGLYTVSNSDLITLFFNNLVILQYVQYMSLYLIPVTACIFFEDLFGVGYKSIIRRLWQIHLAYAILFMTGFIILTFAAINDILIYQLETVNWYQQLYPWGRLIFKLILGFLVESRFAETRKLLQAYAIELETKNAAL